MEHEMLTEDKEREIIDLRTEMDSAEKVYVEHRTRFRIAVADYLEAGGSATGLGRVLGVTRGRVYELARLGRDERPKKRKKRKAKQPVS
jgi:hypothetical protein